ncbi:M23 family metallopeptidase [Achromobacter sp. JUb104]|uniref:M23 family metallopeptidase n=1 Tax=Achromobacter sp. JUb104 TaxID=2940590 RepID=UPI00216A992A|nr:M23 family metallopeptidase [Achromobacter sp. JUb104]MCS3507393.1 putative chitinase [Achromobacter sp. JUb104]
MLISAPFLRAVLQAEDAESNAYWSLGEKTGKGAFPVSHQFGWHGGVHLVAPGSPQNPEPVRAIADGVVVYARASDKPKPAIDSATPSNDPLRYYKGWTSNGVLVLKHDTEIGEGVNVTFYSIYQHLHTLEKNAGTKLALNTGDKVCRKEAIAQAGYIYGAPHRIHFEIVADKANVERLLGRSKGELKSQEGRRDCVWGDIHFVLPANTPLYDTNPRESRSTYLTRLFHPGQPGSNDRPDAIASLFGTTPDQLWKMNRKSISGAKREGDEKTWFNWVTGAHQNMFDLPTPSATERTIYVPGVYGALADRFPSGSNSEHWANWHVPVAARTTAELIISISEQRGVFTVTARNRQGKVTGILQGAADKSESSYELYNTAVKNYPGCPSAGFEMLRFGRVLGPDAPAQSDLYNGRLPHIRRIRLSDGSIFFVDLNAVGVRVYSDADFPHWQGWTFIDDDLDGNSRCDSGTLLNLIEPLKPTPHPLPQVTGVIGDTIHKVATGAHALMQYQDRLARATAKIRTAQVSRALRRCVVKIPTEWSRDDFDQRWSWLKVDDPDQRPANVLRTSECLSDEAYGRLKRHHLALAFWEEAQEKGLALDKVHYHFHPLQFIEEFAKCMWLSESEFIQLLPKETLREHGSGIYYEPVKLGDTRERNIKLHQAHLNLALRKNLINTPLRMATFFANALQETTWLQTLRENDSTRWYYPWDGRGFLQLTHATNYIRYWDYRGREKQISQETREALSHATKQANSHRSQAITFLGDAVSGVTAIMLQWRSELGAEVEPLQTEAYFSPSDSAGFYWSLMKIARYADGEVSLERRVVAATHPSAPTQIKQKIYYHATGFRNASASINYPKAVNNPSINFNGYIARCIPFAQALAVLGDFLFPDASGRLSLEYPEGHTPRREPL